MKRYIDGATQLACIDPEDVNFATRGSDKNIVLAWVDLKARDLSFVNEELSHGSHAKPVILHLDQLLLDTIRSSK